MTHLRCILVATFLLLPACTGADLATRNPSGATTAAPSGPNPGPTTGGGSVPSPKPKRDRGLVTRVVDGDTIHVLFRGRDLAVRLIGIDTPETVAPNEPVECYGRAASNFAHTRLDGERVHLEFDVELLDRFGRTLAYVWEHGTLFNEVLVRRGFAIVTTFPPNVKYEDRFLAAQRDAQEHDRGLWGACLVG